MEYKGLSQLTLSSLAKEIDTMYMGRLERNFLLCAPSRELNN